MEEAKADGGLTKSALECSFEWLVLTYVVNHDIDNSAKKTKVSGTLVKGSNERIQQTLEQLGFNENIEQVILKEWNESKSKNEDLEPADFTLDFLCHFHNYKMESVAPDYIKTRNRKIIDAYHKIISIIEKIQRLIADEGLQTRIESDFRNHPAYRSTLFQCTTPFCIVSLGCDTKGRCSLVYSVDQRFQELISRNAANTFIRKIYEFTPGEMEPFVMIGSLHEDCVKVYHQILEKASHTDCHKVIRKGDKISD